MVSAVGSPLWGRMGARCPVGQGAGGRGRAAALGFVHRLVGADSLNDVGGGPAARCSPQIVWMVRGQSCGVGASRCVGRAGEHTAYPVVTVSGVRTKGSTRRPGRRPVWPDAVADESATGRVSAAAGGPRPHPSPPARVLKKFARVRGTEAPRDEDLPPPDGWRKRSWLADWPATQPGERRRIGIAVAGCFM